MNHCTFISFHFKLLDIATLWSPTFENFVVPDVSRNYRLIDITHLHSNDVKVSVLGCRHSFLDRVTYRLLQYFSTPLTDGVMQYVKEVDVLPSWLPLRYSPRAG